MYKLFIFVASLMCHNTHAAHAAPGNDIPKRAIVIGASVGMGKELSKMLAADGYIVGMAARRITLLEKLQREIPTQTYVVHLDASKPYEAVEKLQALIQRNGWTRSACSCPHRIL